MIGVIIFCYFFNGKWQFFRKNIIPVVSIPVTIVNLVAFFYLLRSSVRNVDQEEVLTEDQTEMSGFKNKITYIPKLFKYMIPLALAAIFQFFGLSFFVNIDFCILIN